MAVFQLIFGVSLSIFLVARIDAKSNYTVVPNSPASNCHYKNNCSLMYYASHPEEYFCKNNTLFEFLPGNHSLVNSTLIVMANISNLTLRGVLRNSSNVIQARVMCSGTLPGGFSFHNITNLTIENLSFVNCSNKSSKFNVLITIEIWMTYNLTMNNINISNTTGYGLMLDNLFGNSVIFNTTIALSHSAPESYAGNFAFYCSENTTEYHTAVQHQLTISYSTFEDGTNVNHRKVIALSSGVYVHVVCNINISIVFDHVIIRGNQAQRGGNIGIFYVDTSFLWTVSIFLLNSEVTCGSANIGGGLYMTAITKGTNRSLDYYERTILNIQNTTFENNSASYVGAAVYLRLHQNYNSAVGKILFKNNCTFTRNELLASSNNSQSHGGVGVHILIYALPEYHEHKTVFFKVEFSECTFLENRVHTDPGYSSLPRAGALYTQYARSVSVRGCKFISNNCTGIVAIHSNLLLHGNNTIRGNTGMKGGGILFCASSMMHLYNGTQLTITENNASLYGGGIYVEDDCSQAVSYCFFQIDNITDNSSLHNTKVLLINNSAEFAGTAIYGGLIDNCTLFDQFNQIYKTLTVFNAIFNIDASSNDLSIISSTPVYVKFCKNMSTTNSHHNCTQNTSIHAFPGSRFNISAFLMGQHDGLVSGIVDTTCVTKECTIQKEYWSQYFNSKQWYPLNYTVFSKEHRNVTLKLVAQDYFYGYPTYRYQPSFVFVHVEKCPLGFIEGNQECTCFPNIKCNIREQTITRVSPQWIGYKQKVPVDTKDIICHPFCPLGYCLNTEVSIQITDKTFDQDKQCEQYRTGLLCGRCRTNYSLGFGSSHCLQCKDSAVLSIFRVIGLIAVCAVAGILLVVLLTLFNLTVTEGTLNGLIFYVNIVQVNSSIFFPPETSATIWSTFIAWLNLDFGITVCFYDGMNAYVKTWLQFLFPLYIWLISGAIVYFSRKSNRVARLTGKNAVKVLATLFLLSFGKLIRNIIAAVSFTTVISYNRNIQIVAWLPDASVHYLYGKHIVLFIFAVLAAVISICYIFILTFIQCLRRAPNNRMCGWVQKLKPILDAYTGPYKNKYHFWTGLLLLLRVVLFVSFAFNFRIGPTLNLALIICASTLLMIVMQRGIYHNQFVGLLESSIYVNLILFSVIMMVSSTIYKTIAAHVFGGWTALTFLGIVLYHAYKLLFSIPNYAQVQEWRQENLKQHISGTSGIQPLLVQRDDNVESDESEGENEMQHSSWNRAHLREPLVGSM